MADLAANSAIPKEDIPTETGKRVPAAILKTLLGLLAAAYLLTSSVIIVNAFAWLPGLPEAWYAMQKALYWPFQPYLALMGKVLGNPSISYSTFVIASRAPFIVASTIVLFLLLRRKRERGQDRTG